MHNMVSKMKLIIPFCLLLLSVTLTWANDSRFYGVAGNFYPVSDSSVEIQKETLIFTLDTGSADGGTFFHTRVKYEFFNNGPEKNIKVGFVSPGVLKKFSVLVNGRPVKFEKHLLDWDDDFEDYTKAVYLFDCNFKEGLNRVEHSLDYISYSSSMGNFETKYLLTPINNWADSKVKDFRLIIRPVDESTFYVPYSFESGNPENYWKIKGSGRMEKIKNKMFLYVKSGSAVYSKKNFRPDREHYIRFFLSPGFDFGKGWYYNPYFYFLEKYNNIKFFDYGSDEIPNDKTGRLVFFLQKGIDDYKDSLSVNDIELLKDFILAANGMYFTDKQKYNYFNKFVWYIPDKSIKRGTVKLNKVSLNVFKELDKLEKEKIHTRWMTITKYFTYFVLPAIIISF